MMKTIKVTEYGPAENLKVTETDIPEPTGSEVLVRLKYAGINPVDTYHRANTNGYGPSLPFTPGIDGSGTIEKTGSSVSSFKAGDRVYLSALRIVGTYAEYVLADESEIRLLPDQLSFEQGAGLFVPFFTAWAGLFLRGRASSGETVLIHGASGAVGQACLQIAKASGLYAIATAGTEQGMKMLENLGADVAVNHSEDGHIEQALQLCGGRSLDLTIEFRADMNLQTDLEHAGKNGRIVIIGNRGETKINPRLTMGKNLDILGFSLFNLDRGTVTAIHTEIEKGSAEGWLNPQAWKTFNLDQAARAHTVVENGPSMGRVLMRIQD